MNSFIFNKNSTVGIGFCLVLSLTHSCSEPISLPRANCTLDTTSHFVQRWQTDKLGVGNASAARDLAIFESGEIWVVGSFFLNDSSGQLDPVQYTIARLADSAWTYSRDIQFELGAIFGFSEQSVWVGTTVPYFWDGQTWTQHAVGGGFGGSVTRIWALAQNDVYMIGTDGAIAHFDGSTWQRIESGTSCDLTDIWGMKDGTVWISGYDLVTGQASILLAGSYLGLEKRYEYAPPYQGERTDRITGIITSIWTDDCNSIWAADGGRIWRLPLQTHGEGDLALASSLTIGFLRNVKGLDKSNDVFIAGDFGTISHFNGATWFNYEETFDPTSARIYWSIRVTDSLVALAGVEGGNAIVTIGNR